MNLNRTEQSTNQCIILYCVIYVMLMKGEIILDMYKQNVCIEMNYPRECSSEIIY